MAGVAEKLYPPTLSASIPAFYQENGTAVITVPFSMNRAVSRDSVKSFTLKIKTAQSNIYIKSLQSDEGSTQTYIGNRVVKFYWTNFNNEAGVNKVKIGQYLKVQLAYNTKENNKTIPGYFSTVAIVKFTSKPDIYINGLDVNSGNIPTFKQTYTGVYKVTEDVNERPYAYNFYLYDYKKTLIEESGWILHNSSVNSIATESLQLSETTDTYNFTTGTVTGREYYIQYAVRTINNLEVYSPMYICYDDQGETPDLLAGLIAENIFEEGYILLSLQRTENVTKTDGEISIEISRTEIGYSAYDETNLDGLTWRVLKKLHFVKDTPYSDIEKIRFKDYTVEQGVRYLYSYRQYNENGVCTKRISSAPIIADFEDMFLYDGKLQLKIRFNPKVSSFKINRQEQKMDTIGSKFPFMFRNGIVEYKEFPIGGLISYLADNNKEFFKDEDDLNIIRNDDAYRIYTPTYEERFTQVEVNALNFAPGKYYIYEDEKYIIADATSYPDNTVFYERTIIEKDHSRAWENAQTLDSIGYNMRAERRFKLKLLEWLGDGNIKLFRSPAEGNYLVRLMNISLTPEDKLGRMIHSFQATAYEVEELNYKNLYELGFINIDNYEEIIFGTRSIPLIEKINEIGNDLSESQKINEEDIFSLLQIYATNNTQPIYNGFVVRIGGNNESRKAYIGTDRFEIIAEDQQLPNIWLNLEDNIYLSSDLEKAFTMIHGGEALTNDTIRIFSQGIQDTLAPNGQLITGKTIRDVVLAAAADLFGNAQLTYSYRINKVVPGEVGNISNVYIRNVVASAIGPTTLSSTSYEIINNQRLDYSVLQWYAIDIKQKPVITIYEKDNRRYSDASYHQEIVEYDINSLYQIDTVNDQKYFYSTTGNSLSHSFYRDYGREPETDYSPDLIKITLSPVNEQSEERIMRFYELPILDLKGNDIISIQVGARYQLDYARQEKTTETQVSD